MTRLPNLFLFRCSFLFVAVLCGVTPLMSEPVYRSPFDIAISADGAHLAVSDRTAGCVYLDPHREAAKKTVQLKGEPRDVIWSSGDQSIYAAEYDAGTIAEVSRDGKIVRRIVAGPKPVGLAEFASDGQKYLAVTEYGLGEVRIIDLADGQEINRITLPQQPFFMASHPTNPQLAIAHLIPEKAANSVKSAASISMVDGAKGELEKSIRLPYGSSNVRQLKYSPDGRWLYVLHTLGRTSLPTTQLERGWINTNAMSIIHVEELRPEATVLLDQVTLGAADPWGIALSVDGNTAYVTLAGAHELARIDLGRLHRLLAGEAEVDDYDSYSGSAAQIWSEIKQDAANKEKLSYHLSALFGAGLLQREEIDLPGPRDLELAGENLIVAGYYSGELALVDPATLKIKKRLTLGEQPKDLSAARRGEMIFHDANYCFQKWVSCVSCHPDGRADGMNWDLLNDGIGNAKNAKSLLLTDLTPPSMSLGVRSDWKVAVEKGLRHFQLHDAKADELEALQAYIASLKSEPSPHLEKDGKMTEAALRGKSIFESAATGCVNCHQGELFTDLKLHDVGTGTELDTDHRYDTPTLVEIWRTAPYLHDGRAETLEQVLTEFNPKDRHGRTSQLSAEEIADLVSYLESL